MDGTDDCDVAFIAVSISPENAILGTMMVTGIKIQTKWYDVVQILRRHSAGREEENGAPSK